MLNTLLAELTAQRLFLTVHQTAQGFCVHISNKPAHVGQEWLIDHAETVRGIHISDSKEPLETCIEKALHNYRHPPAPVLPKPKTGKIDIAQLLAGLKKS